MVHYECCDTVVTGLFRVEATCDSCRDRMQDWQEDLEFELFRDDNYGR